MNGMNSIHVMLWFMLKINQNIRFLKYTTNLGACGLAVKMDVRNKHQCSTYSPPSVVVQMTTGLVMLWAPLDTVKRSLYTVLGCRSEITTEVTAGSSVRVCLCWLDRTVRMQSSTLPCKSCRAGNKKYSKRQDTLKVNLENQVL